MILLRDNSLPLCGYYFGKDGSFHGESTNQRISEMTYEKIERLFQLYKRGERNMASTPATKVRQWLFHFRKWHINIAAGRAGRADDGYGEQPWLTNRIEVWFIRRRRRLYTSRENECSCSSWGCERNTNSGRNVLASVAVPSLDKTVEISVRFTCILLYKYYKYKWKYKYKCFPFSPFFIEQYLFEIRNLLRRKKYIV